MPVITVSMLLNSCAMPPVSWPTASIFCAWISCSSAARFWVTSLTKLLMTVRPPRWSAVLGGLDQDLVAVPVQQGRFEPDADRRIRQLRQQPHHALPEAVAQRLGDEEVDDVGAERLLARPSGQGLGLKAPLQDDAVLVGLNEGIERGLDDGLRHLCAGLRLLGQ